jgi:hypothetical protein
MMRAKEQEQNKDKKGKREVEIPNIFSCFCNFS